MLGQFATIWSVDFEFGSDPDHRPLPVCMTARELRSGRRVQLWHTEFGPEPPYETDRSSLFLSYHASAETGCHLKLGWPLPVNTIDLEAEFRCATTGYKVAGGKGVLGALGAYGLEAMSKAEKTEMRDRIIQGEPFTRAEREAILEYCWLDTDGAADLFPRMLPEILGRPHGLEFALLRGEYSARAVAWMEHNGTPLDMATLARLRRHWEDIKLLLVDQYNPAFDVYEGMSFRTHKFEDYLVKHDIPWPLLASNALDLKDDTFKEMGELYPQVEPLRQLRHTLSQLRVNDLVGGQDGRNRTMIGQFVATTSRNAPKAAKYIFGPSTWLRSLIQPPPGRALVYLDWEQQEFVTAATLSNDGNMLSAVQSDDAYMAFAKLAKLVPQDARREDHEDVREVCKRCCLGILYGMGVRALAIRTKRSELEARTLMEYHKRVFPTFWKWSERAVCEASLIGHLDMTMGWRVHDGPDTNPRALMNAPMQGNAAEMMRVAACLGTRSGVQIDAVVHDAFLIETDRDQIQDAVATMKAAMDRASSIVLDGVVIDIDGGGNPVVWPDRYFDKRGRGLDMWQSVVGYLTRLEQAA